jgi:hypothetical protein
VRCVRSEPSPGPTQRFTRSELTAGQPVVLDAVTDLAWEGCAAGLSGSDCSSGSASNVNWQAALSYCENLNWGGLTDWRLPCVTELFSILDNSRDGPAIDPATFPATPASPFWSSSSYAGSSSLAWGVSSSASWDNKTHARLVRCVRGGP